MQQFGANLVKEKEETKTQLVKEKKNADRDSIEMGLQMRIPAEAYAPLKDFVEMKSLAILERESALPNNSKQEKMSVKREKGCVRCYGSTIQKPGENCRPKGRAWTCLPVKREREKRGGFLCLALGIR